MLYDPQILQQYMMKDGRLVLRLSPALHYKSSAEIFSKSLKGLLLVALSGQEKLFYSQTFISI
jgi:hypothetical protein